MAMDKWRGLLVEPFRPLCADLVAYDRSKPGHDLLAGLTVAVLSLPQAMAYAFIA